MKSKKSTSQTYYELLGVAVDASTEDIQRAYRELAKSHHPDSPEDEAMNLFEEEDITQTRAFKILTFAYHTLTTPHLRAEYDKTLPPPLTDWSEETPNIFVENLTNKKIKSTSGAHQFGKVTNFMEDTNTEEPPPERLLDRIIRFIFR